MRKIALFCVSSMVFFTTSYAQEVTPPASPASVAQAEVMNMPEITVTELPEGQEQISILIRKEDETTQEYIVKVDRQGNQETLIKTTDVNGQSSVSVLGQSGQVQVKKLSDVAISEDGILVDADASAVTPADE